MLVPMSKPISMKLAIATIVGLLFGNAIVVAAEGGQVFEQRLGATESLIITIVPTNRTWRAKLVPAAVREANDLAAKGLVRGLSIGSINDSVSVTMAAQSAYFTYYTNAATQKQIPLWIQYMSVVKEDPGFEGRLTEVEKRRFPLVFLGAYFNATNGIGGMQVIVPKGKARVWYLAPLLGGKNEPLTRQGIWLDMPNEKTVKASRFKFDVSKSNLSLQCDYDSGEQAEFLIDPTSLELIPMKAAE